MSDSQLDMYSEELLRETEQAKIRLIKLRQAVAIDQRLNDIEEERKYLVAKLSQDALLCLVCRGKFGDVVLHNENEHRVCSNCYAKGIQRCPICNHDLTPRTKVPLEERLFGGFCFYRPRIEPRGL